MSGQGREITPAKTGKGFDPQTTTNLSYGRQTERRGVQELKDRTNENVTFQLGRQSKYSEGPSRYLDRQNMTLMREYQSLKLKVRQLQAQNKQLQAQMDKMDYEKCYMQKQYKQKLAFEQQSLLQLQKAKNYHLQLLQIKGEEEMSKLRRQHDVQMDEMQKEIKAQQYNNRQQVEEINYLELRTVELKKELENVQRQLIKARETNSIINQKLTKEEFNNKKLSTLLEDLQRQKNEMEMEIHVLLDIEAEKSRTINALELQLCNTEASERNLQDKVAHLTQNFSDLEAHITLIKQRLIESDQHAQNLQKTLLHKEDEISQNQLVMKDQQEREIQLRQQLDVTVTKMTKREKEVEELMMQNQRLYRELNKTRHQLHQISINHAIDL